MTRHLLLNAFHMNTVGHQSPGLWTHPRDRSRHYTDLSQWTDLARTLERGLFDGLFLADVLGVYDVYAGSRDAALKHAVQVPVNDPSLLIPAMAHVTEHLGFGVTCTLSYEPPYPFARRMSTLDHLTKGRIGWNIVTGYLDSAAKGMGKTRARTATIAAMTSPKIICRSSTSCGKAAGPTMPCKADKNIANFRRSRARAGRAAPGRVLPARRDPSERTVAAAHARALSGRRLRPRTWLCRGACGSRLHQRPLGGRGRALRRRHPQARGRSGPFGRRHPHPLDGDRHPGARRRGGRSQACRIPPLRRSRGGPRPAVGLDGHRSVEVRARRCAAGRKDRGQPIRRRGLHDGRLRASNGPCASSPRRPPSAGAARCSSAAPRRLPTSCIAFADQTGVDGFNLAYAVFPESFTDFIDLVVPELQKRGRFKTEYAKGTLREKLFPGGGARLPASHPAAGYRFV